MLLVSDNNELSDDEKFSYLRSYLAGGAQRLQKWLALTSSNYKVALKLLERRFGITQVIIKDHLVALYKLPLIRNSKGIKNMQKDYDNLEMTSEV